MEEGDKIDALFANVLGKNFNQKNRNMLNASKSGIAELLKKNIVMKMNENNKKMNENNKKMD